MLNTLTEYAGYFYQITEEEEGYVGTIYEFKDGKLVEMACTKSFRTFLQASVSARRIIHSLLMDFFIDTVDTMRNGHAPAPTTEDEQEKFNEEDVTTIPLADVQYSLDEATRYLAEMDRQHKLGQWLAYLFESIEEELGKIALYDAEAILRTRLSNGRW